MKMIIRLVVLVTGLLMLTGCSHKSYHPWLGEDLLVKDDRMAGVWQGLEPDGREIDETEIFLVRAAIEMTTDEEASNRDGAIEGYYAVTWIDNDSVEVPATVKNPFVKPKNLFAALYRIDDILLAQMWGATIEGDPLVAPMHIVYKVQLTEDILTLYNLKLDNLNPEDLRAEGLLFEANEDDPILFFSPTAKLEEFIRKHLHKEGFFNPEPSMKLKRLRDLSGIIIEEFEQDGVEILEPVR